MDKRDQQTWVVLELSHTGESRAKEGTLEKSLRYELGVDSDFPIFVPIQTYHRGDKLVRIDGMQGYAFVGTGLNDHLYFSLEDTPFVRSVISVKSNHKGMRDLACVGDDAIEGIRNTIRREISDDLQEGMEVRVRTGLFSYLEGTLLDRDGDDIIIQLSMRSIQAIIRVNGLYVDPLDLSEQETMGE